MFTFEPQRPRSLLGPISLQEDGAVRSTEPTGWQQGGGQGGGVTSWRGGEKVRLELSTAKKTKGKGKGKEPSQGFLDVKRPGRLTPMPHCHT